MSSGESGRALIRILWKSFPYGWVIRSLDLDGNFLAELLIETPPFRQLHSGKLPFLDATHVHELSRMALECIKSEPILSDVADHIGLLSIVENTSTATSRSAYHYYMRPDRRASTRHFLAIVFLLDSFIRPAIISVLARDDIWLEYSD